MRHAGSPAIELLGEPGPQTLDGLRAAMLFSFASFDVYRQHFSRAGVSERELRLAAPVETLRRLPPMDPSTFHALADESISRTAEIVDMETSSGTTGPVKRRPITADDERSETELLVRLFDTCGIGPNDTVACIDTGPLTIMVSFAGALQRLGVREAYAYTVSPDVRDTVGGLVELDPTVIITIPSIIERYLEPLRAGWEAAQGRSLARIVYVGESLAASTRSALEDDMGIEVFAYYGASETSALGIECGRHTGVHLFTDRNVIELANTSSDDGEGEVLVTTLRQRGLPLLRYPLGDVLLPRRATCPCGLAFPLVDVVGRKDATASVMGTRISYSSILDDVYRAVEGPKEMEIVLTRDPEEALTIRLPRRLRDAEPMLRKSIMRGEPEMAFLVGSGFLAVAFDFVDDGRFDASRKRRKIVDRRDEHVGPA